MYGDRTLFSLLAYGDTGFGDEILHGFLITIQVSAGSYSLGFLFGLAGAGAKLSGHKWLMRIGDFYTTIIRALPELLLLLLLFYTGTGQVKAMLMGVGLVGDDFAINPLAAAICSLGFIQGAYLTEVIRGAIQSVPKGQLEAARAYGMPFLLRFRRILFPQMIRYALPGLGNIWLNATKDSAFIAVLGAAPDLLKTGIMAASATKHYLFFFSFTAGAFLFLSVVSMLTFHFLERRVNRGVRRI